MRTQEELKADFCVVGGGAGGLSFAAGAAQMGAKVILLESHRMGGDCLYTGCVPSKSLIAVAKVWDNLKKAEAFGSIPSGSSLNFEKVNGYIHDVIRFIEPHDSEERFTGLGVRVIKEKGWFCGDRCIETENYKIRAKRFILATGSSPQIPPIQGLEHISYLTTENLFELEELPKKLMIIGAGPIGSELGQAFRRLGSEVVLLDKGRFLPQLEYDAAQLLRKTLMDEGIAIHDTVDIDRVETNENGVQIYFRKDSGESRKVVEGTHLFVAAGRKPNIFDLQLDKAGIDFTPKGITISSQLQTTNPRVYAIGDCASSPFKFTHVAGYHAGLAIRNSLFALRSKIRTEPVPWVIFTDPEVAHVGFDEDALKQQGMKYQTLRSGYDENDRACAEDSKTGFIKVLVTSKGKILGVTIVGKNAGELIHPWVMAIQNNLSIGAIAQTICSYPTFQELNKKVAGAFYTDKLFGSGMKRIVRFLMGLKS